MADRPNLILIMCDQLRADALECYGNDDVRTPNIARLAEHGVCFDRAYSQTPVCVPARHALLSGRNAFEIGLTDNTTEVKPPAHPLPEELRHQGYSTHAVGKMHFTPPRRHHGFDRMLLAEEIPVHIDDDDYLRFLRDEGYGHVIEPHGRRSETYYVPQSSPLPASHHSSTWIAERSCEVIRRNANRPFFLFASFIKPHPPFEPSEPYYRMYRPEDMPMPIRQPSELDPDDYSIRVQNDYKVGGADHVDDADLRRMRAHYYGAISQVDTQIGTLLDTLEDSGIAKNTLIILTADHGEMLGDHHAFGKRTFYEASARIPLIVSWPTVAPEGQRRDQLACLPDIYATFVDAAGGSPAEDVSGVSLRAALEQPTTELRDDLIGEFGSGPSLKFMRRFDNLKYVYHCAGPRENLFDLANDPDELDDIATRFPDVLTACRTRLAAYYRDRSFDAALDGDELHSEPFQIPTPTGYLDQYPRWPETII